VTDDLRVPAASDPVGFRRSAPFTFTFDGETVVAHAGETIGGALLAAGRRTLRQTRVDDRPRGLFCGIGVCFDCLVVVDGRGPVRACLEPARADARVETHRVG
jgi:aerobic-type carbon monoxide dehydrogenase small subunit (CoxS/CutS family)